LRCGFWHTGAVRAAVSVPHRPPARQVCILETINASGTTIVMVTHNPELAARAHRRVSIIDGEVVELHGSPAVSAAEHERANN
jgi:ABC-type cobalamin/Fe3+-siderophores transport system ATPase subunit